MDGKRIDVITVRLDHAVQKTVLASEDDGQFRPAVHLQVAYLRIVDLFEGSEMHDRRCHPVLLGRLPYNARGWCVGHLGGFAEQGVQQIAAVELAEPVDLEVAVDPVGSFAVLVGVDAGGENELLILG